MTTDQTIWDFFLSKLENPFGVAGLMGNLYVESHLNPMLLQSSYARKLGMTSAEYTQATDNGSYANFVRDGAGYGLVQWTFWSRKQALLDFAKTLECSIGNLNMQLNYLWTELQKYTTVINTLKSAKSVREASDIVALRYEKPSDTSEKALQNRANFGLQYYEKYAGDPPMREVIITTDKVNIRLGNSKKYGRLGQVNKNAIFEWVATAENGWHAIVFNKQVAWVSGEFSTVK